MCAHVCAVCIFSEAPCVALRSVRVSRSELNIYVHHTLFLVVPPPPHTHTHRPDAVTTLDGKKGVCVHAVHVHGHGVCEDLFDAPYVVDAIL